jgi:hypothetical protein
MTSRLRGPPASAESKRRDPQLVSRSRFRRDETRKRDCSGFKMESMPVTPDEMQCGHSTAQVLPVAPVNFADTTSNREPVKRLGALNFEIDDMTAALPVGPVEPVVLLFDVDVESHTYEIGALGTVIAPRGVLARHVEVRGLPKHARPGRPLQFDLALSADYPCTAPAELEAAAASLVPHVHVDASLVCGEVLLPLLATLAPAAGGRSVYVFVPVPASTVMDSIVFIHGISVAGQRVMYGQSLPAHVALVTGMLAPLRLEGAANHCPSTPAISGNGTLYAPRYDSPELLVFSADGTPLPSLSVANLGLSTFLSDVAFDEASATLLLVDDNDDSSFIVAVDEESTAIRWSAELGSSNYGIAVLSTQGLVVTSTYASDELRVHQLSDGALVTSTAADDPAYIASDPSTSTLYVSTRAQVTAFRWNGSALVSEGIVEAAGDTGDDRPLAVVPPAPGQRNSFLVVGTYTTPTLVVLSLPDRRLVHTHTLEGMQVVGLAADPTGTALAVCDAESKAMHVLPWPLPGMPPLQ